jgi:hypothetical protein
MSYGHSDAVLAHISAANKASMAELTAYQDAEASGKIAAHQALQRRQRRGQEMSKNYPEDDATHRDVMKGAKTGGGLAPPDRTAPRASGGLAPGSTPPGRGEYGPSRPLSPGQTVTPGGWAGTGAPKQENVGEPRSGSFNDAHNYTPLASQRDGSMALSKDDPLRKMLGDVKASTGQNGLPSYAVRQSWAKYPAGNPNAQQNVGAPRGAEFDDGALRAREAAAEEDHYASTVDVSSTAAKTTRKAMNQVRQPGFSHNNPAADNEMLTSGETMGENYAREKADTED